MPRIDLSRPVTRGAAVLAYVATAANRTMATVLPTVFDGNAIGGPILVLLLWAVIGVVVTLVRGGRAVGPEQAEQEAAAGAAAL